MNVDHKGNGKPKKIDILSQKLAHVVKNLYICKKFNKHD